MNLDEYEHLGDVDAPYEPSRRDKSRQKTAEGIAESVRQIVDDAPPISGELAARLAALLSVSVSGHPPHTHMRWRGRLFCGHVIEWTAHRDHRTVHAAHVNGKCPECGLDPAIVVAAEPLGLVGDPPPGVVAAPRGPLPNPRRRRPVDEEPAAEPRPEFMNTAEVAAYFRTSDSTIRYWRQVGRGPKGVKVGRRVLYARADVERYVADLRGD